MKRNERERLEGKLRRLRALDPEPREGLLAGMAERVSARLRERERERPHRATRLQLALAFAVLLLLPVAGVLSGLADLRGLRDPAPPLPRVAPGAPAAPGTAPAPDVRFGDVPALLDPTVEELLDDLDEPALRRLIDTLERERRST